MPSPRRSGATSSTATRSPWTAATLPTQDAAIGRIAAIDDLQVPPGEPAVRQPARERAFQFQQLLRRRLDGAARHALVDRLAVLPRGRGDILRRLHAAFDLQRVHARGDQLRHEVQGREVRRAEQIFAVLEVADLAVADQFIGQPALLGALRRGWRCGRPCRSWRCTGRSSSCRARRGRRLPVPLVPSPSGEGRVRAVMRRPTALTPCPSPGRRGECFADAAKSSIESSRASTTRQMPSRAAIATPSLLVIDICVEAWIGKSGAIARISRAAPKSCTMAASTPADTTARTDSPADRARWGRRAY